MKKSIDLHKCLLANLIALAFLLNSGCASEQTVSLSEDDNYEIATPEYAVLAEKSIDLWASNEFETFALMLTEDVEYEFPDGKKISGKTALIDYWKNYKKTSGIQSMKIMDANYLPVNTHLKLKANENPGVKVVAYFTNKITIHTTDLAVKMHFNLHFSKAKMIDLIMTYYDQTPIINASYKTSIPKI